MNDHNPLSTPSATLEDKDSLHTFNAALMGVKTSEELENLESIDHADELVEDRVDKNDMLSKKEKNLYAPSAPPEEIEPLIQEAYNPHFQMFERKMASKRNSNHSYLREEIMNELEPIVGKILESKLEKYFSSKESQRIDEDKGQDIQPNSLKRLGKKLFKKPVINREVGNIASFSKKNKRETTVTPTSIQEHSQYTVKELTRQSYQSSKKPKSQAKEIISIYR